MRTAYLPEIASGAMKLDVATRAATKTIAVSCAVQPEPGAVPPLQAPPTQAAP